MMDAESSMLDGMLAIPGDTCQSGFTHWMADASHCVFR